MTPLAALTAAPTATLQASTGAAATAARPPGEFARCMERAQGPAHPDTSEPAPAKPSDAAAVPRGSDDGAAAAEASAPAGTDNERESDNDDEAAAAAPDLSLLLPGWPPAAAAAPLPATGAATTPPAGDGAVAAATSLAAVASNAAAGVEHGARGPVTRDGASREPCTTPAAAQDALPPTSAASTSVASAGSEGGTGERDGALGESAGAAASTAPTAPLQGGAEPRPPTAEATAVPSLASAPAAVPTSAHAKAAEPAAVTALVAAAIDTPSFAPSLASQLRWWAGEGVQQAQLQLNPAEMGPVAVRIVVDGREARIDFSADLPATRNALESALPVLAAALDEGGLKLTGGGVHDGAAQRQAAWQAPSVTQRTNGGAGPALDAAASATASRGAAVRGLVDLVA